MRFLEINPKLDMYLALRRLRYPDDVERTTRGLAGELARRLKTSIEWESYSALFDDLPEAIEAMGKVYIAGVRTLAIVTTAGNDPEAAHREAHFFAIREALIGVRAVCGVLLNGDGVHVTLEPERSGNYRLAIALEPELPHRIRKAGSFTPRPSGLFTLDVRLELTKRRTRYLLVHGIGRYPDLKSFLRCRMRIDRGPIRLHTVILALAGHDMRERVIEGGVTRIHGHHLNGIGYDCRRKNLDSLRETLHRRKHVCYSPELGRPMSFKSKHAGDKLPGLAEVRWDQALYQVDRSPVVPYHIARRADHNQLDVLRAVPSERRNRRQSLDRVVIALMVAGGEIPFVELHHALIGTPCDSVSGIRKVIRSASVLGILDTFKVGRRLFVRLLVRPPRCYRWKREEDVVIRRKSRVVQRLRLQERLKELRVKWLEGGLQQVVRRVLVPMSANGDSA